MEKKQHKKLIKEILFWFSAIFLALIILIGLFLSFLTTSPGEDLLKSIAVTELEKAFQHNVSIGKLETNLVSRIQIKNLNISKTISASTIPFVEVNNLVVNYSLWQLILQNINIQSLRVDSLELWVLRDGSGFYNLPLPSPSPPEETEIAPEEESAINILLGSLALDHGTFHYNDESVPVSGTLRQLAFQLKNKNGSQYFFATKSYNSNFNYDNHEIPIDTVEVEGEWTDQKLQFSSSLITFPGYELTGNPSIDFKQESPGINGELQLIGSPATLMEIFHDYFPAQLYPVNGEVNMSLELDGNIDKPRIATHLSFPQLDLSEIALNEGIVEAEWYDSSIKIRQFNVRVLNGAVTGNGQFKLGDVLTHTLDLSFNNIDLAQAWRGLYHETSPYQGNINGQINSKGPIEAVDSLLVSANLTMQKLSFKNRSLPDFALTISLDQAVAKLDIHQAESQMKAKVNLADEKLQGDFSVKIFRIEPFAGLINLMGLQGGVNAEGDISGTMESPNIMADFTAGRIRYQNIPLDTLRGSLSYIDDNINFGQCIFSGELTEIDSTAPPLGLTDLRGGFSYYGNFRGSLENPIGEFNLYINNPAYAGYKMDSLSFKVSTSNKIIHLEKLLATQDSVGVLASGEYFLQKSQGNVAMGFFKDNTETSLAKRDMQITATFDFSDTSDWKMDLRGGNLELARIAAFVPEMKDVDGLLNFKMSFAGTPDEPQANLGFNIQEPRFQQVFMDSIAGKLRLESNYLYLQRLLLAAQGNQSWFEGNLQLRKPVEKEFAFTGDNLITLSAEGDDIDLRLLNSFLESEMYIAGVSSYRFEIAGSLNNPQINGEFNLSEGVFRYGENSPPVTSLEVDVNVEDSLLYIEQLSGQIQKTPFNLRGRVAAKPGSHFNSDVQLSISDTNVLRSVGTITENDMDFNLVINQFDLSFLQPFVTQASELTGVANSNIKIEGSFLEPDFSGNLNIENLSLQPTMLNVPLTGGVVKLSFQDNQVQLDSLYLQLNEGSILNSGYVTIENKEISELNLESRARNIRINQPDQYLLTVNSAQIFYKKQDQQYLLNGDIVLGESKILYNFKPRAILPFSKKVEQPAETPSPIMRQTRINVRVRESDHIWIDNNLAHLRLDSEIAIIGNLAQPNISGRVAVEEGYVLYLDRKFQMERGIIDFIDPNKLNPIIDLEAKTSVTTYERLEGTTYEITLKITGPLDQAEVELTSEPTLERSDIVALLTVGATRKQLTGKSTTGEEVTTSEILEQRMQTLSSRIISGYAGKTLERVFGLEDVTIQGNLFRRNRGSGPQLVASKRISSSAKLTYTTTVGHLNEQGFRLDYRLSKHFSLEGQTDQQGESSLSIKYNLKFK